MHSKHFNFLVLEILSSKIGNNLYMCVKGFSPETDGYTYCTFNHPSSLRASNAYKAHELWQLHPIYIAFQVQASPRSTEHLKSDSGIEVVSSYNLDGLTDAVATIRLDREATESTDSEGSSDEYDTDIEPSGELKRKYPI